MYTCVYILYIHTLYCNGSQEQFVNKGDFESSIPTIEIAGFAGIKHFFAGVKHCREQ